MEHFIRKILIILFVLSASSVNADNTWDWVFSTNGVGDVKVTVLNTTDNSYYAAGEFTGTITFQNSSVELTSASLAGFVGRFNGNTPLWVNQIGGTIATINGATVDAEGNFYLVGAFTGSCVFYSQNTEDNVTLVSVGDDDGFLAKYDTSGNLLFAWHVGEAVAKNRSFDAVTDSDGNVYVGGFWRGGSIKFSDEVSLTYSSSNTWSEGYLVKYSSSGVLSWVKHLSGDDNGAARINGGLILSPDGSSIVAAAGFKGKMSIDGNLFTGVGTQSFALVNISSLGVLNWVRTVTNSSIVSSGNTIDTDGDGYYACGSFNLTATFNNSTGLDPVVIASKGGYDGFVAKYALNGDIMWIKQIGGISEDKTWGVSASGTEVSTVGYFNGTVYLGDDTNLQDTLVSVGMKDGVIANFSKDGGYLSSATVAGTADDDIEAVLLGEDGNSIVGGLYASSEVTFGDHKLQNTSGNSDGFIAKHINIHIVPKIMEISCADGADGALHIAIHGGGVQPYTYAFSKVGGSSIGSGTYSDTLKFENLSAGTYSIVVTDGASHSVTKFYAVSNPIPISIGGTVKDVEGCYGEQTGEITLTVTGGTGEYAYLWDSQDGYGYIPTVANQSNITAGNYTVKVIDSNGCEAIQTFTVTQPSKINFTGSEPIGNTSSDPATPNGLINLVVNNATAPTYSWQGPNGFTSTDASISGLRGGTYVLTVTAGTCSADTIFNITDQYLFNALVTTVINPRCKGGSDGSATVEVFNSTGGVTAQWSNGQTNVLTATNLQAGLYSITLTDDSGTPDVTGDDVAITLMPVVVSEPDFALEVATTPVKPTCPDSKDGEIAVSVNGWSFPYTFTWTESEGGSGVVAGQKDQEGLTVGYYTVVVTDVYGCEITKNVNLGAEYGSPSIVLTATPSANVSEGTPVTLTATGGLLYEFFVNDVSQGASSSKNSITIDSPVNGTKVVVNGYNTAGCLGVSNEIVITVGTGISTNPLDALSVYPNPFSNCLNISKPELVSRIEVLSIVGQKVLDVTPNGTGVIEVEQLPAGVYLLRISGKNGETSVRKIIKE